MPKCLRLMCLSLGLRSPRINRDPVCAYSLPKWHPLAAESGTLRHLKPAPHHLNTSNSSIPRQRPQAHPDDTAIIASTGRKRRPRREAPTGEMREFMAYVQNAFYDATGWTQDNSYPSLNSTADGTLFLSSPSLPSAHPTPVANAPQTSSASRPPRASASTSPPSRPPTSQPPTT